MNGNTVSYGDLGKNIRKAAGVLKSMGIHAGDRIILSAHKDVEYLYLYFGAHILGVTNVIVDAEANEERLHYIEKRLILFVVLDMKVIILHLNSLMNLI